MSGWKLVGTLTVLLLAAFGAVVSIYGTDEEGLRVLVRATARLSFALFVPVYVASSLRRLVRNDATRWLLKNRRYLGVSFFVAHMLHLDAIALLAVLMGDAFESPLTTILGGGLAYVLIIAMAATSFDGAVARLGARRWQLLHRVGIHFVAFIWLLQWLGLTTESLAYAPLLLLMLATYGVRWAARRGTSESPAPATA